MEHGLGKSMRWTACGIFIITVFIVSMIFTDTWNPYIEKAGKNPAQQERDVLYLDFRYRIQNE